MIYTLVYLILIFTLATLVGLLLRVTFPDCTRTHCAGHHA